MSKIKVERALLSVYYKDNIVELGQFLASKNIEILSTGGTFKILKENNIPCTSIEDFTGEKEIFGGRVKTLNPIIHGGILSKRDKESQTNGFNSIFRKINVILVGCLSAVISAFSPFWGLIFIFAFGVKYQEGPKSLRLYGIFLITVILLLLGKLIDVISFSDIIVGVGLTSYIYFRILSQRYDYVTSIFGVFLLNIFY